MSLIQYQPSIQTSVEYARITMEEIIFPLENGGAVKVSRRDGKVTFDGEVDVNEAASRFLGSD